MSARTYLEEPDPVSPERYEKEMKAAAKLKVGPHIRSLTVCSQCTGVPVQVRRILHGLTLASGRSSPFVPEQRLGDLTYTLESPQKKLVRKLA